MDTPSWDDVRVLFDDAIARPPAERAAFLSETCEDPALRREVEELLAAHDEDGPMDHLGASWTPASEALTIPDTRSPDASSKGRRVGPYRVIRRLGRGGMGEVFLAERVDGQFERQVALKLMHDGIESESMRERFLHERQTLARLEHPGIARLIDGGLADGDRPYFAMEVVEGERIDRYCDEQRYPIVERLDVFGQVCRAVHHAHQRLVVHRDLKPSNILVTDADGKPTVKLLDFGIARLIEEVEPPSVQTRTRLLTPEYAAPEQISGSEISTATDVYSLGVVLYELLTGQRPFALANLAPGEVVRAVCETEPPAPSTVVSRIPSARGDGATLTPDAIGHDRGTEPDMLVRRLRGDLDTICLKALDKDPARRYASAEAFLDDIRRHLDGLPVQARPASAGYRVRKFVSRHRAGVAAAMVAVLALLSALAGMTWQAGEAARERDRARVEADKAEQSLEFLLTLFESSDPSVQQGDTLTAREVLDRGAEQIDALADQPEVQATLLDAMGRVYQSLGRYANARPLVERGLSLRRAHDAPPEDVAASLYRLGLLDYEESAYEAAEEHLKDALAVQREHLGPVHPATAATEHTLGALYSATGRAEDGEPLLRRALETRRQIFDATHREVRETTNALALLLHRSGNMAAAETLFAEAVQHGRALSDQTHPAVEESLRDLGRMRHRFRFDYAGAEPLFQEALTMARTLYGDDHPNVATSHTDLAQLYRDWDRLGNAEANARASLAIWTAQFGPDHRETLVSKETLASILRMKGELAEAERLQREALRTSRDLLGDDHFNVLSSQITLANILTDQGRYGAAERLHRSAFEMLGRLKSRDRPSPFLFSYEVRARHGLGRLRLRSGDAASAEALFREALDIRLVSHDAGHWRIAEAQGMLGEALTARGKFEDAERLLQESLRTFQEVRSPQDPVVQRARERLDELAAARR